MSRLSRTAPFLGVLRRKVPAAGQGAKPSLLTPALCVVILALAFLLGLKPSALWLALLGVGAGAAILLQFPPVGLVALVLSALLVPLEIKTGTAVTLNLASLLVPAVAGIWVLDRLRKHSFDWPYSATTRPLALFLAAGSISLLIGTISWDPDVPRPGSFILVQLAQLAIFFFSAAAFWFTGNLIRGEGWLRRLTFVYLGVFGLVVLLFTYPQFVPVTAPLSRSVNGAVSFALHRAPFWSLLSAVAGGQLLFNRELSRGWRAFLWAVMGGVLIYAFHLMRSTVSHAVGVIAVLGVLGWLRFPRLRWPVAGLLVVLAVTGLLSSTIYDLAGGDLEWQRSGGSRIVLTLRVLEVTLRNPITGLGPAAYRLYAMMEPLAYGKTVWAVPIVSSHNNYVDLVSHTGVIGLGFLTWFTITVARLGLRLRARFTTGFSAGYINAMLAVGASALTLMLFADWILPFVYDVGFPGFQASVLFWMFLGGLVTFEQIANRQSPTSLAEAPQASTAG